MNVAHLLLVFLLQSQVPCEPVKPCGLDTPAATPPVATYDGHAITAADLDEQTRQAAANVAADLKKARLAVVQDAVDDLLLHLGSQRRREPFQQFLYRELMTGVSQASDEEVAAEVKSNPNRYRGTDALNAIRARSRLFEAALKARRAEVLAALAKREHAEITYDGSELTGNANALLARVGRHRILASAVAQGIAAAETNVLISLAEDQRDAAEQLVHDRRLKAAADARGVTVEELVAQDITGHLTDPTEEQLREEWAKEKADYGEDFDKVRDAVKKDLVERQRRKLQREFDETLMKDAHIDFTTAIPEGRPIPIDVSTRPRLGPQKAPVTIVEWGDFQCPPCGRMAKIIDEALRTYDGRVSYVFRNFPLSIHSFAWKAAEAAQAANAQGKFYPYMHLLFEHQNALDVASLQRYATEAGLDRKRFDEDLASGRYASEVFFDKYEGTRAGVVGTPVFFINGVRLSYTGYSPEGFAKAIERALAGVSPSSSPSGSHGSSGR